jgi:hypothetical protein
MVAAQYYDQVMQVGERILGKSNIDYIEILKEAA